MAHGCFMIISRVTIYNKEINLLLFHNFIINFANAIIVITYNAEQNAIAHICQGIFGGIKCGAH